MNILYNKMKKQLYPWYLLLAEKTYKHEDCSLNYIFRRKADSKVLLVIFSGIPNHDEPSKYNYIRHFRSFPCNQIYILDNFGFDKRTAYYLGQDKDFFIERAVKDLIEFICTKYQIDNGSVITCGSSKGGYCALYFAFKYNFGAAVSGAPQILLGSYLNVDHFIHILEYIGGNTDKETVSFLDGILFEAMRNSKCYPRVYIHVSQNEHHYPNHVVPFLEVTNELGIEVKLDLGTYKEHGDIGLYFPSFVMSSLKDFKVIA